MECRWFCSEIIIVEGVHKYLRLDWNYYKSYRYECSVGESSYDTPQGIFHEVNDRVWYDAGQNTECVFTLKRGT